MYTEAYFLNLFLLCKRGFYWLVREVFSNHKKKMPNLVEYWDMLDKVDWCPADARGQHKRLRQNSLAYFFTLVEIAEKSEVHQKLFVDFGYYVEGETRKPSRPKDN